MTDEIEDYDDEQSTEVVATRTPFQLAVFAGLVTALWLTVAACVIWISAMDLHRDPTADLSGEVLVGILVACGGTAFLARVLL
jgi:hypothetical protein